MSVFHASSAPSRAGATTSGSGSTKNASSRVGVLEGVDLTVAIASLRGCVSPSGKSITPPSEFEQVDFELGAGGRVNLKVGVAAPNRRANVGARRRATRCPIRVRVGWTTFREHPTLTRWARRALVLMKDELSARSVRIGARRRRRPTARCP